MGWRGVLWDGEVCCGMVRCVAGWRGVLWDGEVSYKDEDIAQCVFCFLCCPTYASVCAGVQACLLLALCT